MIQKALILTVSMALAIGSGTISYKIGYKAGYAKGWSDKPQQVINTPKSIIINKAPPTGYWYGLRGGQAWGIGICHK